jgi:hypothetical protein
MFSGMGIPGGCIGQDTTKRYTPAMFGGYHEIPTGMSETEFWVETDHQIKEMRYNMAAQADRVLRTHALAQEQVAHPVENTTAQQYDQAHNPAQRPDVGKVRR